MNSFKISSLLNKKNKNEDKQLITYSIGTVTRMRRLELKMTLEQVASNICSVSYLSKVESNKIIPNPDCVALLMEKMDIPKYEQYLIENESELLNESLNYFYTMDIDSYGVLFNKMISIKNCVAYIIVIGYYLLNGEYDKCESLIDSVEEIANTLSNKALSIYSLYTAYYNVYINEYKNANILIDSLKEYHGNEHFDVLLKEVSYMAHIKEGRYIYVYKEFDELNNYYSRCGHYQKIKNIKLLFMRALFDAEEYKEVVDIGANILFESSYVKLDEFNYLMGNSLAYINKTIAAKDYLDRIGSSSPYYKKCLFTKHIVDLESGSIIEEVEKLNKENPDFYYQYFLEKTKNGNVKKELFTSPHFASAIKDASTMDRIDLYRLYAKALEESFRYKEATALYEKIDNLRKSVKSNW